jgi:hypothetical protein
MDSVLETGAVDGALCEVRQDAPWRTGSAQDEVAMNNVWFARSSGSLIATDDDSQKLIERMGDGECRAFKPIGVRDSVEHRRYWVTMTLVGKHCRRIEIDRLGKQPAYMRIHSKEDAHTAMKLCTGLYDTLPVGGTDYAIRVPKSTDFDRMTPEEWKAYWPKVIDVLVEKAAPEFDSTEARDDMLQYLERWQLEAA